MHQFCCCYRFFKTKLFELNCRDNVEWDQEQENIARLKVEENSEVTLTEDAINKLEKEAAVQWDKFYGIHQNRFNFFFFLQFG